LMWDAVNKREAIAETFPDTRQISSQSGCPEHTHTQ